MTERRRTEPPDLEDIRRGGAAAVGRALTLVARGDAAMLKLARGLSRGAGASRRVGVTGAPGVGKSSLLREVARCLRERCESVALVASDPVSPATGGAFLGDRLRFGQLMSDPQVFIRSLGHRGRSGEPTPGTEAAANLLEVAGYRWIFFETVGTGQTETGVLVGADVRVLVLSPDSGDGYQMLKAGMLETADVYVVNKADRPAATSWARELEESLTDVNGAQPIVVCTNALTGAGVSTLVDVLSQKDRTE